jgi:hypothetical protein
VKERSWKKLLKIAGPIDRHLLFTSTWVQIGNGEATPFWEARWLDGAASNELSPSLFEATRYKKRTVAKELQNNNWMRGLTHITTPSQLHEFSLLFMAISNIILTDSNDIIYWKWIADKRFPVASKSASRSLVGFG